MKTEGMEIVMKYVGGHVEVYDQMGNFLFSADTEQEAWQDAKNLAA